MERALQRRIGAHEKNKRKVIMNCKTIVYRITDSEHMDKNFAKDYAALSEEFDIVDVRTVAGEYHLVMQILYKEKSVSKSKRTTKA
jgi:hypothetical protein